MRATSLTVLLVRMAAAAGAVAAAGASAQEPPFGAIVEVRRLLVEVRVLDSGGEPVPGLEAADFEARIDGEPAEVESASWVPVSAAAAARQHEEASAAGPVEREPRLVVVVFQTDINHYRMRGAMRMAPHASRFVRDLDSGDLAALFTFESHLELRADFTADLEGLAGMLSTREILAGAATALPPAEVSIAEYFDAVQGRRAATLSRALELVGRALIPIPGPKTVVLFGWGLGRYNPGHPIIERGSYYPALGALSAARATVFTLDVTTADWHTLEHGLRALSEDTGGLYLKTHIFPDSAMARLSRTVSSYYELSIVPPDDPEEIDSLEIEVRRRGVSVHHRRPLPPADRLPGAR